LGCSTSNPKRSEPDPAVGCGLIRRQGSRPLYPLSESAACCRLPGHRGHCEAVHDDPTTRRSASPPCRPGCPQGTRPDATTGPMQSPFPRNPGGKGLPPYALRAGASKGCPKPLGNSRELASRLRMPGPPVGANSFAPTRSPSTPPPGSETPTLPHRKPRRRSHPLGQPPGIPHIQGVPAPRARPVQRLKHPLERPIPEGLEPAPQQIPMQRILVAPP
jgi:hypothetical protein